MVVNWRRNLAVLWVGNFLAVSSFTMVMPFLPLYIRQLGVTEGVEAWSSIIFAAGMAPTVVLAPIWGRLADRYGRRSMVLRAGVGLALTYLLMAVVQSPWQLLIVRVLSGAATGFVPGTVALMATTAPEDRIGRVLGTLQTGHASGLLLGPLIGGVLADLVGVRQSLLLAMAALAVSTLLVLLLVREGSRRDESPPQSSVLGDVRQGLAMAPLRNTLLASVLAQTGLMGFFPILPLYVLHLSDGQAPGWVSGAIISSVGVAAILAAPRWGRLGERVGFGRTLTVGAAAAAVILMLESLVGSPWQLLGLHFLFGLCVAANQPSLNSLLATQVPHSFRGRAYGMNHSAVFLGGFIGPLLGGAVASLLGLRAVFFTSGLALAVLAWWSLRRLLPLTPPLTAALRDKR